MSGRLVPYLEEPNDDTPVDIPIFTTPMIIPICSMVLEDLPTFAPKKHPVL
jgi:hypothetical protein